MSIRIKPGETLSWSVKDDSGDISGASIEAALGRAEFYQQLTVTPDDLSVGEYTLSCADTSAFPVGSVDCDLKYSIGGMVVYTETFRVFVDPRVTK